MALGSSLTLSQDQPTEVATNTEVFALNAADIGKGVYSVAGLTSPNARVVTISHEIGSKGEARHLVRLDSTLADPITGIPTTYSVYTVIIVPPSSAWTAVARRQGFNQLLDALVSGTANARLDAILNNEV